MAYTLRGRIESRLVAALAPVLAAAVLAALLERWWPVQLAALMIFVGLLLDAGIYHRLIHYQPGWAALPLGVLELGLILFLARAFDVVAPIAGGIGFFVASWLLAQLLGHAGFPLFRLSYGDDGGELGSTGQALAVSVLALLAAAGGIAWAHRPPTVHLSSGVHPGPLVLDHRQNLVGEPGAVVRGGIRITADDVKVKDVAVTGKDYGIEVDGAQHVVLEDVTVLGAALDGIHVRRSSVTVKDCLIDARGHPWEQGIDISFSADLDPSMVEGCTIVGGREGIVTHSAMVMVMDNEVSGTTLRGITVTEMSMGEVDDNRVRDALGVGIFCGDRSMCEISGNSVAGTRPDHSSDDRSRLGFALVADFEASAELHEDNDLSRNPRTIGTFAHARVIRHR